MRRAGVALAVQRHAHAPHDRIPGVVKLALARRRARVDHLVLLVLTLEIRAGDVEPVPTATEEHRAGDGGLYHAVTDGDGREGRAGVGPLRQPLPCAAGTV